MIALRSMLPLTLTFGLCAVATAGQSRPPEAPAVVQTPGPMRLTTDSVEYCGDLAKRVRISPALTDQALSDEVMMLVREGQRMCAHGLVIGGVARLRRALMLAQGTPPPQ
jgi:hypothetical protein